MRIPAVLVGQAVGDALGMPFEQTRDKMHPDLEGWEGEMRDGTYHDLPAGHWTDDTEMAVALAETLIDANADWKEPVYPADKVARAYYDWSQGTPHGMGGTTRRAMQNLAAGMSYNESGIRPNHPAEVGSGTAMRCAPMGVVFGYAGTDILDPMTEVDARITHDHEEACAASIAVVHCVDAALRIPNISGRKLLETALMAMNANYANTVVFHHTERALDHYEKGSDLEATYRALLNTGQVIWLVPTALYCAARYAGDFKGGVIAAIRGGGDTDTRAAIVGAILGARNGLEGIPVTYTNVLHRLDYLMELDRKLLELRG